jgi:hypothetical protein
VVVFDGISDGQSKTRKGTNKEDGEVWEVVMASIGFGDLKGREKIDRFLKRKKGYTI